MDPKKIKGKIAVKTSQRELELINKDYDRSNQWIRGEFGADFLELYQIIA
jgi:hypothetical protein